MNDNMKLAGLFSYAVSIKAYCEVTYTVATRNRSSALYKAYLAGDYGEYISYSDFIKSREIEKRIQKLHSAILKDLFNTEESLTYCKKYRGMEFLELGLKVKLYDNSIGYVISSESNLKAYIPLLDKIVMFHPTWHVTYHDVFDRIIIDYIDQ